MKPIPQIETNATAVLVPLKWTRSKLRHVQIPGRSRSVRVRVTAKRVTMQRGADHYHFDLSGHCIDRRGAYSMIRYELRSIQRDWVRKSKVKYPLKDAAGMKWRMAGSRPVSQLADQVMQDCGLPIRK